MADTNYGVNHNLAQRIWAAGLFHEALKQTMMGRFVGGQDALIYQKMDLTKSAGSRITYGLRMQLTGDGIAGDDTLEGNEEAMVTYTDDIYIDQLRHAMRSSGRISEQRVNFDVREEMRMGLADWLAGRMDTSMFNQLAGKADVTDTRYTGSNATTIYDASHVIYAGGSTIASEASVGSASASNYFKLQYIDAAVEKAKTLSPLIRPIKVNGQDKYVCFLHPYQVYDLRVANTGTGQWVDIQKAAMQGGRLADNPIYTGAIGEYNNTILYESTYVPTGTTSNVKRAIFCGAQAACVAWGKARDNDGQKIKDSRLYSAMWNEKSFDYGNKLGVSAGLVWGIKKTIFNSADFGTIVIATAAAAH